MAFQPILFSGFTLGGSSGGGGGGVSSVALALPVSVFTISGSPVTSTGTLTGSFTSQSANTFFAAPNGSAGTPSFRLIVPADIPSLSSGFTGVLPIANGGTNSSSALTSNKVIVSVAGSLVESATTTTQLSFLDATSSIQTQLNGKQATLGFTPENSANKGIANGYAGLDGAGKVPYAQLPSALMTFKGAWDPTTNTPTLTNGVGLPGDTYRASVDGASTAPIVDNWFAGDFIIYNGTIWQRSPLADGVISVNGLTGAVTLTRGNLTDVGTDGIVITGGTNAVWGTGTSIAQHVADSTHNGYLSSTDFNTFSATSAAAITALTGDVSATGPGSAAATISSTTVTGKLLTGFVSGPSSPVLATDSVLQGLEKLQAQITSSGGTVTSVALALPVSVFTVSGSPVTTTGTLTGSFATQTANTVFAGPATGVPAVPTFRSLVAADIPLISLTSGVSGILPTANGGTGQNSTATFPTSGIVAVVPSSGVVHSNGTVLSASNVLLGSEVSGILPVANGGTNSSTALNNNRIMVSSAGAIVEAAALTDGQLLIGSTGAAPVAANLTAGTGISIINAAGSITITATNSGSTGDISQTSFTAADNQSSPANITGLAFANASVRSFEALVSIVRNTTYSTYKLYGIQKGSSWEMSQAFTGDSTGISFSITTAGQVQYTSTSTGFTSTIKFRAIVTNV